MRLGRFFLGAAAGFAAGYVAWRAYEATRPVADPTVEAKADAASYGRTRRALAVGNVARTIASTVAFAYGPTARSLERLTTPAPEWLRPAIFAAVAGVGGDLVELPVALIEDYRLERRYGLSDQPLSGWFADYVKTSLIGTGVTAILATIVGAVVRRMPRAWPVLASIGTFPLLVLANIIVPIFVLPLFNRFEPLQGPLEERLRTLASRFGVGDAEILRMDMSRQTKKANAFVAGIGSTHRIVLGDTLIENFEPDEVEFVVAHELGHYVTKDTWRMIAIGEATAIALLFAAQAMTKSKDEASSAEMRLARIYAVMSIGSQLLRPLLMSFSRSREWAADRFALEATRDAAGGAAAFRRLRDQNLSEDEVPAWYEFFFSSHPSLGDRIEALETA
jgi:STE24 endopeptidase